MTKGSHKFFNLVLSFLSKQIPPKKKKNSNESPYIHSFITFERYLEIQI